MKFLRVFFLPLVLVLTLFVVPPLSYGQGPNSETLLAERKTRALRLLDVSTHRIERMYSRTAQLPQVSKPQIEEMAEVLAEYKDQVALLKVKIEEAATPEDLRKIIAETRRDRVLQSVVQEMNSLRRRALAQTQEAARGRLFDLYLRLSAQTTLAQGVGHDVSVVQELLAEAAAGLETDAPSLSLVRDTLKEVVTLLKSFYEVQSWELD